MADVAWGLLLHLSMNMWTDRKQIDEGEFLTPSERVPFHDNLPEMFDEDVYAQATADLAEAGGTMVVLDLGDGVVYDSHPEIAAGGAWSKQRLADELARLRDLGLEPIPKLNFSSSHDAWLREWSRQLSTPAYYTVCRDLIAEVTEAFDGPRFFHVGMDEEQASHQLTYDFVTVRQGELWWHDLNVYLDAVRAAGPRPWMWSDMAWGDPSYYGKVAADVVQSNWYYDINFDVAARDEPAPVTYDQAALTYLDLAGKGFDQIPTGASWRYESNMADTVRFCAENLDPAQVLGFLQTIWKPTQRPYAGRIADSIQQLSDAKAVWEDKGSR